MRIAYTNFRSFITEAVDLPSSFEQLRNTSAGEPLRLLVTHLSRTCINPAIINALLYVASYPNYHALPTVLRTFAGQHANRATAEPFDGTTMPSKATAASTKPAPMPARLSPGDSSRANPNVMP